MLLRREKMENVYEVLQTLGRGSFGIVRKVRRREDGKTLVVKEMDYGAADEKQKEQIVAEVRYMGEEYYRCCAVLCSVQLLTCN